MQPDQQGQQARSHQRCGGDDADLKRAIPQRDQIERQQQADIAVAKRAQRPYPEQPSYVRRIHRPGIAPKLKSSNSVTLSALVQTPIDPAPAMCPSSTSM